ncbi:MAG TPA: hypothetical protein VGF58_05140 [Burkholderiales bacterium]|jgi:hypothetical protein
MTLWSNVGKVQTIAPGVTHHWQITYGNGLDVGVVVAAPNLRLPQINVELVALEQGVIERQTSGDEQVPSSHYTVKIRNLGSTEMDYNLDIGDWQGAGGQAPQAQRISELIINPGVIAFAAKKRAKPAGGRGGKKRATRRR